MLASDAFLYFSKRSNPEDGIAKEIRFKIDFALNMQQTVYLKAKNPVNLKWEYWYFNSKKGSGTYTLNNTEKRIFRITTNEEVEFIITGTCDEISLRTTNNSSATMLAYNLDGITSIPAFNNWNMIFTGDFPEIWKYNKYKTTTHAEAFAGCTYLTNYNEIPDSWK